MIALVVPILRLRRDTGSWSYRLPPRADCLPGSLVTVPFRGKETLGVVWELVKEDEHATQSINQVITSQPLLTTPHRRVIEYMSQVGLCSLSTSLYQWLPTALRRWPLGTTTLKLLREFRPGPPAIKQHCIAVPGQRPAQTANLEKKFARQFTTLFGEVSEKEEFQRWLAIASGQIGIGLGREKAITAPWLNLRHLTVIEPEDVFYYHEQIPYLNFVQVAEKLGQEFRSQVSFRSYLPSAAARLLWGENATGVDLFPATCHLTDLRQEPLLNDFLIEKITRTLQENKQVIIIYNAHDRKVQTDQEIKLLPGIETTAKKLAAHLGFRQLPNAVHLGTRALFQHSYPNVGLAVHLAFDLPVEATLSADTLHAWADLGHLFSFNAPTIIQSHHQSHPLLHALRNRHWANFVEKSLLEYKSLALPPFGQRVVCTLPDKENTQSQIQSLHDELLPLVKAPWQISHPLPVSWHKKPLWALTLYSAQPEDRLAAAIRKKLVALPRPWKVQHNPWYLF